MIDIVLATRNAHKVMEVQRILDAICDDLNVLDLSAWPDAPEVVEDAPTFAGNALLKARAIAAHTGLPCMADDSGICVDALNGMPGIFSARWSGAHGRDSQNLQLLLDQLTDVPDSRRGAQFVCAVALATPAGDERVVEGVVEVGAVHPDGGDRAVQFDIEGGKHGLLLTSGRCRTWCLRPAHSSRPTVPDRARGGYRPGR